MKRGFYLENGVWMEEIKLVNGNIIKIISAKEVKRGQRTKLYPVDDFMGFKLKWYQKIYLSFYDIKLKLLQKYDEWWWKKYIKH